MRESTSDQHLVHTLIIGLTLLAVVVLTIYFLAGVLAAEKTTVSSAQRASIKENMAGDAAVWVPEPVCWECQDPPALRVRSLRKVVRGCGSCHLSGATGAPRYADSQEWAKRLQARGLEGLVSNAVHGYKRMPAKGNQLIATTQVRAAVYWILLNANVEVYNPSRL